MNSHCPPEDQLLAMAAGETAPAEVREHVEQCPECLSRFKLLKAEVSELQLLSKTMPMAPLLTNSVTSTATLLPNATMIGRYVIVANIGSGGQADVYRVVDPDLGRYLVLKLSHLESSADDERRGALLAEGQLLADLDHPGLVRIFDVGIHKNHPYLVLEHVPGRNLEQIYAEKRPSAQQAATLMAEVAEVVAYAHHRGIVHGDITPRNILIDASGHARLIDFGLSNIANAWGDKIVVSGGTPEFVPPEIIAENGNLYRTGTTSDVFGLGATLYWMLTGNAPFAAKNAVASLERARRCEIDFLALRQPSVPRRLARACQQALACDPSQRPTAEVFGLQVQRASRRWKALPVVAAIAAMTIVTCGLFWIIGDSPPAANVEPVTVLHGTPTVSVFRRDGVRTLSNELPLRTGDRIAFTCNIAQGQQATLLWFTAGQELKVLAPVRDIAEKVDRMVYPAPRRSISLEQPEGTEMVFLCRGAPVEVEDLLPCFPTAASIPAIPPHNWLTLLRAEVRIEGALKSEVPDEILQVEVLMKEINRQLKPHFLSVTGIAFPHREPAEAAE